MWKAKSAQKLVEGARKTAKDSRKLAKRNGDDGVERRSKQIQIYIVYQLGVERGLRRGGGAAAASPLICQKPQQQQSVWWLPQFVAFATFASLHAPLGLHTGKRRKSYHDPLTLIVWWQGWLAASALSLRKRRGRDNNLPGICTTRSLQRQQKQQQQQQPEQENNEPAMKAGKSSLIRCVLQWQRESFLAKNQSTIECRQT